jgi:hypothetical protein
VPDGQDVSALWRGGSLAAERELVWGHAVDDMALRIGRWKLYEYRATSALFDLAQDPDETEDRSAAEPIRVAQMQRVLEQYRRNLAANIARGRAVAIP